MELLERTWPVDTLMLSKGKSRVVTSLHCLRAVFLLESRLSGIHVVHPTLTVVTRMWGLARIWQLGILWSPSCGFYMFNNLLDLPIIALYRNLFTITILIVIGTYSNWIIIFKSLSILCFMSYVFPPFFLMGFHSAPVGGGKSPLGFASKADGDVAAVPCCWRGEQVPKDKKKKKRDLGASFRWCLCSNWINHLKRSGML